jgi:para-nitrobenzyl esterase
MFLLRDQAPTLTNYQAAVQTQFGAHAADILTHYHAQNDADVITVGTDLASDLFIGYSTWKWADVHARTSTSPVYRYRYAHPRPPLRPELGNAVEGLAGGIIRSEEAPPPPPPLAVGAVHSADIEYFMGNLDTNDVFAWTEVDAGVSAQMQQIYLNFVRHGQPNGAGVPPWPALTPGGVAPLLHIAPTSQVISDPHHARYQLLDTLMSK